jgi:DNA-binding transcriptional MerR regulator
VSSRSYLSIGDVLTLLREEFPDVTISKIRFLESQGLVNPERSPSGYRKFFEADVERLRWVLRQQREHFLPLKVIRDRLAAGDLGDIEVDPAAEPAHRNGVTVTPTTVGSDAPVSAPAPVTRSTPRSPAVGAGRASASGGGAAVAGRTEAQMAQADDEAMARILADASRRAALIPESGGDHAADPALLADHASSGGGGDAAPSAGADASAGAGAAAAAGHDRWAPAAAVSPAAAVHAATNPGASPRAAASKGGRSAEHRAGDDSRSGAGGSPAAGAANARPKGASSAAPVTPPRGGANGPDKPDGSGSARGGGTGPARPKIPSAMVSGASLTADELCAASGLSEVELAGLQSFGLVEPVMVAGIPTFDEDALAVANLAADFRKFGIEPRHLRMYRNAVDREIGLIEQVIIPLLRQRNPESRQRALDAADELATLGQTMRATLLRSAMRRHVGG